MADKIVKWYIILLGISSLIAIISDLRFFFPNEPLALISLINILPAIIVFLGAIPIIIYILVKKLPVIYAIPPIANLLIFIFYIIFTVATIGEGLGLTIDYIVNNIFNIILVGISAYLILIKK